MDLKHRGITWVGNMFQKFEAVCQEVDSIINQDKVKYVENQVSSASENVKKLYSDVVQGLLPPGSPVKNEAKAAVQRGHVPINAYFKSPSHNEGKTENNAVNKSSVGHGITDQIDNRSQESCTVTFVNEEVAQVPNHSSLELNGDLPLGRNDDVLLDKDFYENVKENSVNELLPEKSDGTLTDKLAFMESDASDPLCHSLRNVSSEIDDTNKRASSVCHLQLENDIVLVGNNDGVLTDKDGSNKSSEEDTLMEFSASDPLKQMANCTSSSVCDYSDLQLEDDILLVGNNDGILTDKDASKSSEEDTIMEFNASDPLKYMANCTSLVCDDSDLQLEDDILLVGNNDGVLTDKDASKSSEEDTIMEFNASDPSKQMANCTSSSVCDDSDLQLEDDILLVGNNDGVLTDKDGSKSFEEDTIMEFYASDPLKQVDNCTSSSVCDDSDLQLDDDILLVGNNDGVLTDKDESKSSEEDTIMEFNASDPLKQMTNRTSCQVKVTNGEATLIFDNSHLLLEFSRLSRKSDDDLSDQNSDVFLKKVVIMEPNATDHLNNNNLSHVGSGTNFVSKEADDSNLLLKSEVLSGRVDHALIDKDFNNSLIKDAIFEDGPNSYLLNLPSHGNGVSFTYEEAIMVSDRNYLLEPELLGRKNGDVLTDKYSNESLKKNTILELKHDASYPLKNQPRCTSSSIKFKNEKVSSVSNDSFLKLKSEIFCGKNSEALIDKASDASCKEQANLKLSTELISHCDEESIKETLCSRDNECEEDIVTSTGNLQETSVHGADVESTHKVGQDSSILVNNLIELSPRMETTSKYLENGIGYSSSSNAPDAISSKQASLVLTSGETVEETKPVSTLKSLPKGFFSPSRSLVKNVSSSTVVHDKPSDQRASINFESHPSFEVVTSSASYRNKALEMKFASSRSSLSSVESVGTRCSRVNESAFLPKFRTSNQVEFSKSTSSGALSFSTEVGFPYNSSGYITDSKMETVDLGHKVTLKDECDIVDYKTLHAVSRRTQKLRSYKERIKDAFTSKKRLTKEYEQLAIWYGDTDLDFSTDSSQKLDTKNVSTSDASDSEWELL